uniref:Transcription repressor n=1 Tax=Kalanchoe fedtschenkoi TaxID=63787 RepID=A0A7N0U6N0_KALFE
MDHKNNSSNKLKLRIISTLFRSSCRDRSVSDTAVPISNPKTTTTTPSPKPANKLIIPPTPNPPTSPFPSIHHPYKPIIKPSSPCKMIIPASCYKPDPARQKLSESYSLFYSAHSAPLLEKRSMDRTNKKKNKKSVKESNSNNSSSRRVRRRRRTGKRVNNVSFWSSSDEEDDGEARLVGSRRRRAGVVEMTKKMNDGENAEEYEDSCYAVVKCSRDPYMDFRTSMVEMIVEKKMEKAEDLERLLQRFLKLNSYRHHPVIIEAFMEIWDALF